MLKKNSEWDVIFQSVEAIYIIIANATYIFVTLDNNFEINVYKASQNPSNFER